MLLRRLEAVRRGLRDANPHNANVAEIAHRFGFAELERFSETYQATFGEAPLTTLQHVPGMRLGSVSFPNFCIVGEESESLALSRWQDRASGKIEVNVM
jgi:hypothetical protein